VSTTFLPGDPRWIGCWWLGYLLVAVGILVMSVPLWFFPASMTDRRRRQSHCSVVYEDNATAHGSDGRPMSLAGSTLKQTKGSTVIIGYNNNKTLYRVGQKSKPQTFVHLRQIGYSPIFRIFHHILWKICNKVVTPLVEHKFLHLHLPI